jgi:hypothetical protein
MPTAPTLFRAYIGPHWRPVDHSHAWDWTRTQDFRVRRPVRSPDSPRSATGQPPPASTSTRSYPLPPKGGYGSGLCPSTLQLPAQRDGNTSTTASYTTTQRRGISRTLQRSPSHRPTCASQPPRSEHNGIHASTSFISRAPVALWAPLSTNDGKLHITEEMDANLCTTTWSAQTERRAGAARRSCATITPS